MSDYDNTNRGGIWKNDKKETDKHPDFTGNLDVDGVEYWVSGWKRDPDSNPKAPALRLRVKKKDTKPAAKADGFRDSTPDNFDDDIPF